MKKIKKTGSKVKVARAKTKRTHITVILDRSGSMEGIKNDIIGGFNQYVADQKKNGGKVTMTLVQFDTENSYEIVHHMLPIADITALTDRTFVPRGGTPLFDAIGRGINDLEKQIGAVKNRPDNVALVIITDGEENSSKEFTRAQVEKMIKEKTDAGWQVVFLSSDLSAVKSARAYGVSVATTMAYDNNSRGVRCAFAALSSNTMNYTKGLARTLAFTDQDRSKQENDKKVTTKK
jgi:Mg-chelatase subunit ChlD